MNNEKLNIIKNNKGFIAALDQSGGSSPKALERYGVDKSYYSTEEEMFNLIHEMRKRVITSPSFTSNKILGVILFYKTMESKIDNKYTSNYLWENKHILSFLKVDKGLREEVNGVKLMRPITDLEEVLKEAKTKNIFGTKMRSVIYKYNEQGIKDIVEEQFKYAEIICKNNLVPILEPEVDINSPDKEKIENYLLKTIKEYLSKFNTNYNIIFKLTIPSIPNIYDSLLEYKNVIRIIALSGGYTQEEACKKLSENHHMIASFSRALLQDLNINETDEEFNKTLDDSINKIYKASIE